jgi:hypothetical protein
MGTAANRISSCTAVTTKRIRSSPEFYRLSWVKSVLCLIFQSRGLAFTKGKKLQRELPFLKSWGTVHKYSLWKAPSQVLVKAHWRGSTFHKNYSSLWAKICLERWCYSKTLQFLRKLGVQTRLQCTKNFYKSWEELGNNGLGEVMMEVRAGVTQSQVKII